MPRIAHTEIITATTAGGTPYEVVDDDGTVVGVIAASRPTQDRPYVWRLYSAGNGVPVDRTTGYPSADSAVAALADTRLDAQTAPGGALTVDATGLTQHQRDVLDFATFLFRHRGSQEAAIRNMFDMSAVRYWQQFNGLLDRPEAMAYAPQTVARHRRVRDVALVRRRAS